MLLDLESSEASELAGKSWRRCVTYRWYRCRCLGECFHRFAVGCVWCTARFCVGWKTHFALSCFCFVFSESVSVSALKGVAVMFNLYYVVTVNKASWLEMVHSANRSSKKRHCLWMHIFQQCASEFETILLRRWCRSCVEIVRSDQIRSADR
jgi:hypothetical protein